MPTPLLPEFKPLPEMYAGTGVVTENEVFDIPPGDLGFQGRRPVFTRVNEKAVKVKKKIVLSDDLLYVLNQKFYTDEYTIHAEDEDVECLSTILTLLYGYSAAERYGDFILGEEKWCTMNYYSYYLLHILESLLIQGFEIFFYADAALIPITLDCFRSVDILLNAACSTERAYLYKLFAENKVPADQVYIIDLPKMIQIIGNYSEPCLIQPVKEVLNLLYQNSEVLLNLKGIKVENIPVEVFNQAKCFNADFYFQDEEKYVYLMLKEKQYLAGDAFVAYAKNDQQFIRKSTDFVHVLMYDATVGSDNISNLITTFPQLVKISIVEECGLFDTEFLPVPKSNLKSIVFNNPGIDEDLQIDGENKNYITNIANGIPSIDFFVRRNKLHAAEHWRHPKEYAKKFKINDINLETDELAHHLNAEHNVHRLDVDSIDISRLLILLKKINHNFKYNVKELFLHEDLFFYGEELCVLLQHFPSLCVLRMSVRNLPDDECVKAEFFEILQERGVKCFLRLDHNVCLEQKSKNDNRNELVDESDIEESYSDVDEDNDQINVKYSLHVDSDTNTLHAKYIFYAHQKNDDPDFGKYRQQVLSPIIDSNRLFTEQSSKIKLNLVKSQVQEFRLPSACHLSLNMQYRAELGYKEYFGSLKITISNSWTPLPSISAHEQVKSISLFDINKNAVPFKIGYCSITNLFYVKLDAVNIGQKDKIVVTANFVLQVMPIDELSIQNSQINRLIAYLRSFDLDNLKEIDIPSFYDRPIKNFLEELYNKRAGACMERAILFAKICVESYHLFSPNDLRIIANEVHMYCEIKNNDVWYKVDFDGSPANLIQYDPAESVVPTLKNFVVDDEYANDSTLIRFVDAQLEAHALGLFQKYCHNNVNVCYIHNMQDLINKNNNYEFRVFIANARENNLPAKLIINFQNFTAEELVRINSMLDPNPSINSVYLPNNVQIIGLYDAAISSAGNDEAFYSRFKAIRLPDPNVMQYNSKLPELDQIALNQMSEKVENDTVVIDCYGAKNWQTVFGQWGMVEQQLKFINNELLDILQPKNVTRSDKRHRMAPVNIVINNPADTEEFRIFWAKASITKKLVFNDNQYVGFQEIYTSKINDLGLSESIVEWDVNPIQARKFYYILNNTTFEDFFKEYRFVDGKLKIHPGFVEKNAHHILPVHLTHNISSLKWAKILKECSKHNVKLRIVPPPDLILPEGFKACHQINASVIEAEYKYCLKTPVKPENFNVLAFDVSEHAVDKLIAKIDYKVDAEDYSFNFIESDVLQRLSNGETIVLYGKLSDQFAEKFASMLNGAQPYLMVNGQVCTFAGQLYCMPNEESLQHFTFAPAIKPEDFPFIATSERAAQTAEILIQAENTAEQDQMQIRATNLKQVLAHYPMAYITGKTGVGKTTFVNDQLNKYVSCKIFHEMEQITSWAACEASQEHEYLMLFIDEANMVGINFNVFASMFLPARNILIEGKIYSLTNKHVVVIAGNAHSYGGDRILPAIAQQYPGIQFEFVSLTQQSVNKIIRATLNGLPKKPSDEAIERYSNFLTKIYTIASGLDEKNVYITIREIKLILYLMVSGYDKYFIISYLFINSLPKELRPAFARETKYEKEKFLQSIDNVIEQRKIVLSDNEYLVTQSRKVPVICLHAMLSLRNKALEYNFTMPMAGVVLEGPPANGKSDLIRFVLKTLNYTMVPASITPLDCKADVLNYFASLTPIDNQYIVCNASANLEVRKEILLGAYRLGLVVVFDELNSAIQGLERLLNDLLMHQYQGVTAQKPGFVLIGSQNEISQAGRAQLSEALRRRLMFVHVPQYKQIELLDILRHKNPLLDEKVVKEAIIDFVKKPITYLHSGLHVKRTLRDLTRKLAEIDSTEELKLRDFLTPELLM